MQIKEKCKQSLLFTLVYFWDTVVRDEMVYNWHMGELCNELEKVGRKVISREDKDYDLIVNIPPGTTKSTITTIVFPVWLWMNDPSIRIISNSYSSAVSIEHAMRSRDILDSEKFKTLFPEIRIRGDKSGKQHYENVLGGTRYAVSTGGSVTGSHAHIIINDDPQNPSQANSEACRLIANEHTKTLSTRKVNKSLTPTILIMQRLHEEDVTGYVLSKKEDAIRHIKLPSEITEETRAVPEYLNEKYIDGIYLDKNRLSRKVMQEALTDLGTRGYNGQFLQNPTAEGGDIIKKEWIQIISQSQFAQLSYDKKYTIEFFLDTAYTDKTENDPSGIIACTKIGNNLYITSATKVRKEFPELIKFIPEWVKANGYDSSSMVRIEPKANGLSVIQTLQRDTAINVTKTPSPKDDKKTRLNSVAPKVESGRVILVDGSWNEDFIAEITGFPNALHDEYVDVMVYAINHFLTDSVEETDLDNILWL